MNTPRFFNTAGPVRCDEHYCLPPLKRFNLDDVLSLIDQKKYFVLHAPRQSGKTSSLQALMDYLNHEGKYNCLYFNVELGQSAREDVMQGIQAILSEMALMAEDFLADPFPESIWASVLEKSGGHAAFNKVLTHWAEKSPKPLVLLIDEIDALVGDTLISVLRQLRAGYAKRPARFPQSIILCGVRDVRDYRIHSEQEKAIITGGSAFNVKAESLRLGNFNQADVETLYAQHTFDTGQKFEPDALNLVWELTQGQPWLVNALGYEVCFKIKAHRNRSVSITTKMLEQAKENLILRRETHLDQLMDKLKEARVQRVIQPILLGEKTPLSPEDIEYVIDLGLVHRYQNGRLEIANRIYQEVIPRELAWGFQMSMVEETVWYVDAHSGKLDMEKLLAAFQSFFRENSEHWLQQFQYHEAGPQLLLQAFLQRILNSGGRVEREYGLGRMRTDLLVIWPLSEGTQKVVIELKLVYVSRQSTITQGLQQTWQYMDKAGTAEGHLLIFDRDINHAWADKIFREEQSYQNQTIIVWGM
ncbi:MAG: ATP-binding protein [Candidatus Parabeggiatoa sp. nov. 3]|nr:MAG: ATP-binding protein [Gammaproteobacteria bacterium]RKZ67575.1 MAG: ATP-binding protein [Gammaproteobacteria bacterium]RKZ86867.1 MAG: ATP-binding protein [Gammaproteobacteria bacterium]HEW98457.1 ATP-binding protein [Beggiatoa sp.]